MAKGCKLLAFFKENRHFFRKSYRLSKKVADSIAFFHKERSFL